MQNSQSSDVMSSIVSPRSTCDAPLTDSPNMDMEAAFCQRIAPPSAATTVMHEGVNLIVSRSRRLQICATKKRGPSQKHLTLIQVDDDGWMHSSHTFMNSGVDMLTCFTMPHHLISKRQKESICNLIN